jgi:DNA-binding transcriptional MerR regulator
LLKPAEVAAMLGYSLSMLKHWRLHGGGPRFIRPSDGGHPRYRPSDIDEWLKRREQVA